MASLGSSVLCRVQKSVLYFARNHLAEMSHLAESQIYDRSEISPSLIKEQSQSAAAPTAVLTPLT